MKCAYICDAVRTPFGRYGGALSSLRTDDLGALPIQWLQSRSPSVDWSSVDDVLYGCANQAGEDNRNVARMASLLAGLPAEVPATTINRLCGSSLDAMGMAARSLMVGEGDLFIAGGVEGMSRAPFVVGKAEKAFSRQVEMYDTTIGWRFVNPYIKEHYGIDSMPETGENVADDFGISRVDQDAFALASQKKYAAALERGFYSDHVEPITITPRRGNSWQIASDEPQRPDTSMEALSRLKPVVRAGGSVTAGNASPVTDGAGAVLLASEDGLARHSLVPRARVVSTAVVGIAPRIMGFAPAPATRKVLDRAGLSLTDIDVIELNEAFAAQSLAVIRDLGLADDDSRLNPNGGAIAIGHPLGASGARLAMTAIGQLDAIDGRYALCCMCIGVGQGIAMIIERCGNS